MHCSPLYSDPSILTTIEPEIVPPEFSLLLFLTGLRLYLALPEEDRVRYNSRIITNRVNPVREMKGPSDISELLSGLKVKEINIPNSGNKSEIDEGSTISVEELKEISNEKVPKSIIKKKSSREKKNTVSLDI